jgi:hypothetical protein
VHPPQRWCNLLHERRFRCICPWGPSFFRVLVLCKSSLPTNEEGLHCHLRASPGRHDVRGEAQSRGHPAVVQAGSAPCRAKLSRPPTAAALVGGDFHLDAILP